MMQVEEQTSLSSTWYVAHFNRRRLVCACLFVYLNMPGSRCAFRLSSLPHHFADGQTQTGPRADLALGQGPTSRSQGSPYRSPSTSSHQGHKIRRKYGLPPTRCQGALCQQLHLVVVSVTVSSSTLRMYSSEKFRWVWIILNGLSGAILLLQLL